MAGGRIFINYRRDDSRADAGRIYDRLSLRFPGKIFRDVGSLEPGIEWHEAIERVLGTSDACVVMIGKLWLTVTDAAGHRRLEDPGDTVRTEIRTALDRNMRVIPVLVGGASMPAEEDLPEDIRALCRRNALEVTEQDWDENLSKLTRALEQALGLPAKKSEDEGSHVSVKARFSLFHGRLVFAFGATLGVCLLGVSVAVYQTGHQRAAGSLSSSRTGSPGASPDMAAAPSATRQPPSVAPDSSSPRESEVARNAPSRSGERTGSAAGRNDSTSEAVRAAPPAAPPPAAVEAPDLAGVWSVVVGSGGQQVSEMVILFPDGSYHAVSPGAPAAAVGKWRLRQADGAVEFFGVNLLNFGAKYECTMRRAAGPGLRYSGACQDEKGLAWGATGTRTGPAEKPSVVIPGLELEGLTDAEKEALAALLKNVPCTCGCGKNLLDCRRDESEQCNNSLIVARQMFTQFMALVRR